MNIMSNIEKQAIRLTGDLILDSTPEQERELIRLEDAAMCRIPAGADSLASLDSQMEDAIGRLVPLLVRIVPSEHLEYAQGLAGYLVFMNTEKEVKIHHAPIVEALSDRMKLYKFVVKTGLEAGIEAGLIENEPPTLKSRSIGFISCSTIGKALRNAVLLQDNKQMEQIASQLQI